MSKMPEYFRTSAIADLIDSLIVDKKYTEFNDLTYTDLKDLIVYFLLGDPDEESFNGFISFQKYFKELFEERLSIITEEINREHGLKRIMDPETGEITWG